MPLMPDRRRPTRDVAAGEPLPPGLSDGQGPVGAPSPDLSGGAGGPVDAQDPMALAGGGASMFPSTDPGYLMAAVAQAMGMDQQQLQQMQAQEAMALIMGQRQALELMHHAIMAQLGGGPDTLDVPGSQMPVGPGGPDLMATGGGY